VATSVLFAIAGIYSGIASPPAPYKEVVVFLSVLWASFDQLILAVVESSTIAKATQVQELFDTYTLSLPVNRRIPVPRPEDIVAASKSFSGREQNLRDWYTDPSPMPGNLDLLLAMRTNLTWDQAQRRLYAYILEGVAFAIATGFMSWGIYTKQTVGTVLTSAAPAVSFLVQLLVMANGHLKVATMKEGMESKIMALWRQGAVEIDRLRDLQDELYEIRKSAPLLPKTIEWMYTSHGRMRTEQAIQLLKQERAEQTPTT
jgi:hypothetical protein